MIETIDKLKLCFVVGRGRSGTTLFTSILNSSEDISIAPESLFIMNLYKKYASSLLFDKKLIARFYNDLWLEERMQNWELDKDGLLDWLIKYGEGKDFPTVCKIVYARHAYDHGKQAVICLGDKNPHYSLFINQLLQLYPKAKFVFMVRDYRDNIVSYQNVPFDSNNPTVLAYRWNHYNHRILTLSKKFPNQFFTIQYEQLICNPEETLKGVCSFIAIKYDQTMLEFYKNKNDAKGDWHTNLKTPLNKNSIQRWKKSLGQEDVSAAESICGKTGNELGYQTSTSKARKLSLWRMKSVYYAWLLTRLEYVLFKLPLWFRARVLHYYRKSSGSI